MTHPVQRTAAKGATNCCGSHWRAADIAQVCYFPLGR